MDQIQTTDNSLDAAGKDEREKKPRISFHPSFLAGMGSMFCALISLVIGALRSPVLYPVDFGQYELLLRQFSLTWTKADLLAGNLHYVRPITRFAYTRFSWSNLLTPSAGNSLIYPIAVVRLFTEPFGLLFHVDLLAVVLCLFLLVSVFLTASSMYRRFREFWWFPAAILCFLFCDGNFFAMLRGLYTTGSAVVFSILHISVVLYLSILDSKGRARALPLMFLTSLLLLKAMTPMIVFLPVLLLSDLYFVWSARSHLSKNLFSAGLAAFLGIVLLTSTVTFSMKDADFFSDAAAYESFFNTLLPSCDNPEEILSEIGLDESYLEDIGKSFYLSDDAYAHNPNDEEEARVLFSKLTWRTVVREYAKHPQILWQNLMKFPYRSDRYESERNSPAVPSETGYITHRSEAGPLGLIRFLARFDYDRFFLVCMLFGIASVLWSLIRRKGKYLIAGILFFSLPLYLLFVTVLNGYALGSELILFQTFLQDFLAVCLVCVLIFAFRKFGIWVSTYSETPSLPFPKFVYTRESGMPSLAGRTSFLSALKKRMDGILSDRKKTSLLFAGIAVIMLAAVYLPKDHVVSVNNGDYGRMMGSIGITWTGEYYYDFAHQSLHEGIEEYAYAEPFNILKLTPLMPAYSLYLFESVIRLFTEPFHQMFSTWKTALLMGIITVLCIAQIVSDCHEKFGKLSALIGVLLCGMLMSETNLAWYNSLFGEGCVNLGLLLSVTCGIHLAVHREEKGWKMLLWLAGLAVSLWILLGAKSQMIAALPFAVLLVLVIAWFHKPYRYDYQMVYGLCILSAAVLLGFSGIGVYRSERDETSTSQKSNIWHAYFYGIFMISDDPIKDMEELGIDTAMAADIGKYVSFDENADYVYAPMSEEAQKAFYDHVSLTSIVKWYLTHPAKLLYMLDYAASVSKTLYQDFRVYYGQDYSDPGHDPVLGFNLWPGWRPVFSPSGFIGYVISYGILLILALRILFSKKRSDTDRMLAAVLLFVMFTGILQFPLSVIGNGFADNRKQMIGFMMCHDLILCFVIPLLLKASSEHPLTIESLNALKERVLHRKKKKESDHEESNGSIRHEAGGDQDVPAGPRTSQEQIA
ncbi:MAG: hypothetical protein IKD66_00315 [Solobacterium sp.]|nr:hypothetical protein [Solobacterium sp.]